ncbi:MAG TPA: DUF1353 domain-containing protein [Allosphingosinicella sp.]|nr:DUF1353 domain-containing protein [Allosphingosinicella sp.]
MELLEDFWFLDGSGHEWRAPRSTKVDGASIPRALWTLVGSPYTGEYRRASIVHDVACVAAGAGDSPARRRADKMFFEACRAGGCSRRDAIILYVGVRIGAWYGEALTEQVRGPRISRVETEELAARDFQDVADAVLAGGETDDVEQLEARTDAAWQGVAARRAAAGRARSAATAAASQPLR